jgi:hypothetical protein
MNIQYHLSVQSIETTVNQHVHQMVVSTQGLSHSITSQGHFADDSQKYYQQRRLQDQEQQPPLQLDQQEEEDRRHGSYIYNDYDTNTTINDTSVENIDNNSSNNIDTRKFPFISMDNSFEFFADEVFASTNGIFSRLWYTPIVNATDYLKWIYFSTNHSTWPIESMNIRQQLASTSDTSTSDVNATQYYDTFSIPIQSKVYTYQPYNSTSLLSGDANDANITVWEPESSTDEIFLPVMYMSPPPIVPATTFPYMNLNCRTDETLKDLSAVSSTLGKIAISSIADTLVNPETIVSIPIYSDLVSLRGNELEDKNVSVVAYVFAVISWKNEMSKLFIDSSASATISSISHDTTKSQPDMMLELKNTCGQSLLYEFHGDSKLHFLGDANNIVYDKTYESYKTTIMLTKDFVPAAYISDDSDITNSTDTIDCQYYIELYPTVQFVQSYQAFVPFTFTTISLIVFVIAIIVFLLYDRFVSINNEKAVAAAARSNALVSSLFPSNVRERLLQEKDDEATEQQFLRKRREKQKLRNLRSFITGNGTHPDQKEFGISSQQGQGPEHQQLPNQRHQRRISIHGITGNNNTSSAFNNNYNGSNDGSNNLHDDAISTDNTGIEIYKSKPIADFFPEATGKQFLKEMIIFCDNSVAISLTKCFALFSVCLNYSFVR